MIQERVGPVYAHGSDWRERSTSEAVPRRRGHAHHANPCPHCGTCESMLTLLTSMVRYYACAGCGRTWNEAREHDPLVHPSDVS